MSSATTPDGTRKKLAAVISQSATEPINKELSIFRAAVERSFPGKQYGDDAPDPPTIR